MKKKLIWVGDACVATGFARATHNTLDAFKDDYEIHVLGLNHDGDPHEYPYKIYTCWPGRAGGDFFGVGKLLKLCREIEPDVIVIQNDVWNIPGYVKALRKADVRCPVVAALAIDGKNCQGEDLKGISLAIFWTKFAEEEARKGGYEGPSAVVPLGVDLNIYQLDNLADIVPLRKHARSMIESFHGVDVDALREGFIVGNVNRNQQRKRLDLTVEYFCEWVKSKRIYDAFLMIHGCPTGEQEYDIEQLMDYHGCSNRLLVIYPDIGQGVPEMQLVWEMRCFDIGMTTTQGEGFGLPSLEMQALGIPLLLPRYSALEELFQDSAYMVPCTSHAATQKKINVVGGIADKTKMIEGLDELYRSPELRHDLSQRGWENAKNPRYRWSLIGKEFRTELERVIFPELSTVVTDKEEFFRDIGRPEEVVDAQ